MQVIYKLSLKVKAIDVELTLTLSRSQLGNNIREARKQFCKANPQTVSQLAASLNLSRTKYYNIEEEVYNTIDWETIEAIENLFGVSFGIKEQIEPLTIITAIAAEFQQS